jgi:hypothetical protein
MTCGGFSFEILMKHTFNFLLGYGVEHNQYVEAKGREEEFIKERVAKHKNPTEIIEQPLTDGRWLAASMLPGKQSNNFPT